MPKPGPDREVNDDDLLKAIRDLYGPAVGTSEIADHLGYERQTIDKHLRRLVDEGLVNTRMIGQVRVWWLSDEGERKASEN